ncbi:hypothetical protein D3C78_1726370 [compost metagenome]
MTADVVARANHLDPGLTRGGEEGAIGDGGDAEKCLADLQFHLAGAQVPAHLDPTGRIQGDEAAVG